MKHLILFSGGLDSTVMLGGIAKLYGKDNVYTIFFDYGQSHLDNEWAAAERIARLLRVSMEIIDLPFIVNHNLDTGILFKENQVFSPNLASSFLPLRNPLFLTIAAMKAFTMGGRVDISAGYTAEDYTGFPDCRLEFLNLFRDMVKSATESNFVTFSAPFISYNKQEIVDMGIKNGLIDVMKMSWSCYLPGDKPCGECDACKVRKKSGLN